MAKFETVAEVLAWRDLEENPPQSRVHSPTFKQGQHKARLTPKGMAQLSYVDNGGALVLIILEKRDNEWFLASTHAVRVSHISMELVPLPRYFNLSDGMTRALQEAEATRDAKLQKKQASKKSKPKQKKGDAPGEETGTPPKQASAES